jgi:hypothetical protein
MKDLKQPEGKKTVIKVLEIECSEKLDPIIVSRDSMSYMVRGGEKPRVSHWPNLASAMQEVSDRLFLGKLTKRAEEGRADFESLVRLVEEHKAEMKEKFRL